MLNKPLQKEELLGSKEIHFNDRQESTYPQLMRLSMDFEICVLQLECEAFSFITKRFLPAKLAYVLTSRNYQSHFLTYSPRCQSLGELEVYVCANQVDILHDHLFGSIKTENCF